MDWSQLDAKFGPLGDVPAGTKVGGVSKTLTNEYWRSLGEGYARMAKAKGVEFVYQAAQSEGDQLGQLSIAENLITQGFNARCSRRRPMPIWCLRPKPPKPPGYRC